jgi:ubiquinone/menaquinone biosynthesis C-methylase UbiE
MTAANAYRIGMALLLGGVLAALFLLNAAYQGINTLNRLEVVESERNRWQRPEEILKALELHEGGTVVDLGCGAGYFALRLSSAAGQSGRVIAVDVRRSSLLFLWIRSLLRNAGNIRIVRGNAEDPFARDGSVDAVLIANTYHEFAGPQVVLERVFRSLAPGGRLVIVDRSPLATGAAHSDSPDHSHEVPAAKVVGEILQSRLEIVRQQDNFIEQHDGDSWWLIVARRP